MLLQSSKNQLMIDNNSNEIWFKLVYTGNFLSIAFSVIDSQAVTNDSGRTQSKDEFSKALWTLVASVRCDLNEIQK